MTGFIRWSVFANHQFGAKHTVIITAGNVTIWAIGSTDSTLLQQLVYVQWICDYSGQIPIRVSVGLYGNNPTGKKPDTREKMTAFSDHFR